MDEKKKRSWFKTFVCSFVGIGVVGMLLLLGRQYFVTPQRLGTPPIGWTVLGETNIERFSFMPREVRRIRCDAVDDRFCHMERPGCFDIYVRPPDTTELIKQTYNLEPKIKIDVPDDQPIWAELTERADSKEGEAFSNFEFHVHTNHTAAGIASKVRIAEPALEFSHR